MSVFCFHFNEVQPNEVPVFMFSYDGPLLEKLVLSLGK